MTVQYDPASFQIEVAAALADFGILVPSEAANGRVDSRSCKTTWLTGGHGIGLRRYPSGRQVYVAQTRMGGVRPPRHDRTCDHRQRSPGDHRRPPRPRARAGRQRSGRGAHPRSRRADVDRLPRRILARRETEMGGDHRRRPRGLPPQLPRRCLRWHDHRCDRHAGGGAMVHLGHRHQWTGRRKPIAARSSMR